MCPYLHETNIKSLKSTLSEVSAYRVKLEKLQNWKVMFWKYKQFRNMNFNIMTHRPWEL